MEVRLKFRNIRQEHRIARLLARDNSNYVQDDNERVLRFEVREFFLKNATRFYLLVNSWLLIEVNFNEIENVRLVGSRNFLIDVESTFKSEIVAMHYYENLRLLMVGSNSCMINSYLHFESYVVEINDGTLSYFCCYEEPIQMDLSNISSLLLEDGKGRRVRSGHRIYV